jgi:hypothetical protein
MGVASRVYQKTRDINLSSQELAAGIAPLPSATVWKRRCRGALRYILQIHSPNQSLRGELKHHPAPPT